MTVILELATDVESRIAKEARLSGKTVENVLTDLINDNFSETSAGESFYETATREEWESALDSLAEFSDEIPLTWDDSRESIYN